MPTDLSVTQDQQQPAVSGAADKSPVKRNGGIGCIVAQRLGVGRRNGGSACGRQRPAIAAFPQIVAHRSRTRDPSFSRLQGYGSMPSRTAPSATSRPVARSETRRRGFHKAASWGGIALALAATYVFFGSSPAGTKAALGSFPPLVIMTVRGFLAGAVLTVWALASGAQRPDVRRLVSSFLVGTLILALGAGIGTIGQQTVASGVVGVLSAMMPLITACLGYLLFRERPAKQALIGLIIGFVGIGLLLRPGSNLNMFGVMLVVVAQIFWALGAVLAPRLLLPEDPRLAAGLELLGGSGILLIASAVWGEFHTLRLAAVSSSSWLGLGWLVLTAIGGFTAYGFLAKRVSSCVSTTFAYVNPVVAVGLGWLLFSEPVTVRMLVATAVVVTGVCLIVSAGGSEPEQRRHHPMTSGHGHTRQQSLNEPRRDQRVRASSLINEDPLTEDVHG
jgi:drug/metabolite transporter (DMT)-like permease